MPVVIIDYTGAYLFFNNKQMRNLNKNNECNQLTNFYALLNFFILRNKDILHSIFLI